MSVSDWIESLPEDDILRKAWEWWSDQPDAAAAMAAMANEATREEAAFRAWLGGYHVLDFRMTKARADEILDGLSGVSFGSGTVAINRTLTTVQAEAVLFRLKYSSLWA